MNYQKMNNSRLPEMWAGETERVMGEQARVLGETERILGEQAYEDVLATVIINKVNTGLDKKSWLRFVLLQQFFLCQPKKSFSGVPTVFTSADVKNYQSLILVFLEIRTVELGQEQSVQIRSFLKF